MKIIKKKENKRKTRIMLNIEKYKDIVLDNINICDIDTLLRGKCIKESRAFCEGFKCEGCRERFIKWLLEEAKEPVLDEVERKYLSDVIRPFRKKVDTISKFHTVNTMQYIYFQMKDKNGWTLPLFKKGTMYKGMVQGKHYTLEELDL